MKKFNSKLVEQILKSTTTFNLNQVNYSIEKDRIIIWSTKSERGAFYNTELIPLFGMFSCYLSYDNNRVELNIY